MMGNQKGCSEGQYVRCRGTLPEITRPVRRSEPAKRATGFISILRYGTFVLDEPKGSVVAVRDPFP